MYTTAIILVLIGYNIWISLQYILIPYLKAEKLKEQQNNSISEYLEEYKKLDSKLEPIYKDKLGNTWYKFKSVTETPPKRAFKIEIATRMANLCLTEKMFDEYILAIKRAVNKADLASIGNLITRMEERRLMAGEVKTLEAFAHSYFLLEGENPKEPSQFWNDKKSEIWKQDEDCYAFFLHQSMSTMRDLSALSATDLLHYLMNQQMEKSLNRL